MQTDPAFTDGRSAVLNPLVECLNLSGSADGTTYQRYEYIGDSIDRETAEKEHSDPDGSPLGSDTRQGFEKGAIQLQANKVTSKLPSPGHILHLSIGNGDEYYIAGKPGRARTRNEVIKFSPAVKRAYNPIIASLLTEAYGGRYLLSMAHAGTIPAALLAAMVTVNTRSGSTLVYSLAAANGSSVPSYLAINSATGALTFTTPPAGAYEVDVVVTETLADQPTRTGFVRLSINLS